jgi:hypothetical protein
MSFGSGENDIVPVKSGRFRSGWHVPIQDAGTAAGLVLVLMC